MKSRWTTRTYIGLILWTIALAGVTIVLLQLNRNQTVSAAVSRLTSFWTTRQVERTAVSSEFVPLLYSDPVFRENDGKFERIAQVIDNPQGFVEPDQLVHFRMFNNADDYWNQGYLELHRPAKNLGRVAKVMLTDDRIQRIRNILIEAQEEHQAEVVAELTPLFQNALRDLRPVIETEMASSIREHRPELDALLDKYKEEIVKQRLLPVVETEVLPVVQRHAQPLMEQIGGEIWGRVSLWRFAWRFVYDESIDPSEPLVSKEWRRFLDSEAIPIIKSHTDEIVAVQSEIIEELSRNPAIRQAIKDSFDEVSNDEEAKLLIRKIMQESLTKNERVKKELQSFFQSGSTQAVLRRVGDRFEPYAVQIGQELFGTPDEVTKEFALVLRHMILNKDQRWLIWKPGLPPENSTFVKDLPAGTIPMIVSDEVSMPPFFQLSGQPIEIDQQ